MTTELTAEEIQDYVQTRHLFELLGFDEETADILTANHVSVSYVRELLYKGCPAKLALRIVL